MAGSFFNSKLIVTVAAINNVRITLCDGNLVVAFMSKYACIFLCCNSNYVNNYFVIGTVKSSGFGNGKRLVFFFAMMHHPPWILPEKILSANDTNEPSFGFDAYTGCVNCLLERAFNIVNR